MPDSTLNATRPRHTVASRSVRTGAALASGTVTAVLIAMLGVTTTVRAPTPTAQRIALLAVVPLSPVPRRTTSEHRPRKDALAVRTGSAATSARQRSRDGVRFDAPTPAATLGTVPTLGATADVAIAPVPPASDAPPSPPIRLDASTIRRANQASRSAVQQMADASGQSLAGERASRAGALASGMAAAALPDCIPTDGSGAGLLNLVFVPIAIATRHCKFSGSR